jgi:quercetin dioxygenase-like cupin family protein
MEGDRAMRRLPRFVAAAVFVGMVLLYRPAMAQDPVAASPGVYKVELENPWVRVLRLKLAPGATTASHAHPNTVGVLLTDVRVTVTNADGTTQQIARRAGDVLYQAGMPAHSEQNMSDQPLEAVLVELKPDASASPPVTLDPVTLDPEHHPVLIDNPRVRVIRTILEPHLKSPMHEHPHYVVVYLTELHTTMKMADGREVDNPRRPGEVAWRDALKHETEQMGDKTAVEIQIELK